MRHTLPVTLTNADRPTVLFAHRGARAHERENTLPAFELAVRLGATGLESDVWVTADGVAVLDHDGVVGGRLRRRPIAAVDRSELPDHIPSLEDLYRTVGVDLPLSLDVKDAAAFEPTTPPPSTTIRPGGTPGTPESRMPAPPTSFSKQRAPT